VHFNLTDQFHERVSFVHGLDPRVKVVSAIFFVLVVSLTPEGTWWAFGAYTFLILAATRLSELELTFSLRRSYIALPFALAALAIPFTTPGPELTRLPVLGWEISEPGMIRFVSILARSWLAVQAAILLTATTRFPDLLWSLSALRIPRPLVSTIGFMYRYLFVLADEGLRMRRARLARSVRIRENPRPSIRWQGRMTGSLVGVLFLRALERSERVYAAMLSRGYDGSMRTSIRYRMARPDWVALSITGLILIVPLILAVIRY
jgi:cobalt/nickel transport system permease protein